MRYGHCGIQKALLLRCRNPTEPDAGGLAGHCRDERLNEPWFANLLQARAVFESLRRKCSEEKTEECTRRTDARRPCQADGPDQLP